MGLDPTCVITTKADSIFKDKGDGTLVNYYQFDEFEIHSNVVAAGTVQEWHHHERISETIYVVSGTIEVRWIEDSSIVRRTHLDSGCVVNVGSSVHTIANPGHSGAKFIVFRFVPDGDDKRDLIKNDRQTYEPPVST